MKCQSELEVGAGYLLVARISKLDYIPYTFMYMCICNISLLFLLVKTNKLLDSLILLFKGISHQ